MRESHQKFKVISDKVYQLGAGYSGELEVDDILPEIGLPENHTISKGITLEVLPNFYIQLDTLIITPQGIILLEVKKYSAGTVQFNEDTGKTIKISSNGNVEKFDCVVHQVDRAVHGLNTLLKSSSHQIPIYPIIVMANAKTDITLYPKKVPVKYKKQLPKYIRKILTNKETLNNQEVVKLNNYIKSCHATSKHLPLCERYAIPIEDIKLGVLCPNCDQVMKKSQGRTWHCRKCQLLDASADKQAAMDWFYLVDRKLSNRQVRHFMQINSKSAAGRILRKLQLTKIGATSQTSYIWNFRNLLHTENRSK